MQTTANILDWEEVKNFALDDPLEEYGFSTRLAYENNWTLHYTQLAILEYKKFMYLAAVGNQMVSPSEIIDKVWHLHLIFTQSYESLCHVLGKRIEHIPSTHKKEERKTFDEARDVTKKLYAKYFDNTPPTEIWEANSFEEAIVFNPSKIKGKYVKKIGVLSFIMIVCFIFLFYQDNIKLIQNPDFLAYSWLFYFTSSILFFSLLPLWSFIMMKMYKKNNILNDLHPFELIYFKRKKVTDIIFGVYNHLIKSKRLGIKSKKIEIRRRGFTKSMFENCILNEVNEHKKGDYSEQVKRLSSKNIFKQVENSCKQIEHSVLGSVFFQIVFFSTIIFCALLLGICFTRLYLGIQNDKAVSALVVSLFFYCITFVSLINRTSKYFIKHQLRKTFRKDLIDKKRTTWEWDYFVRERYFFDLAFLSLLRYYSYNTSFSSRSSLAGSASDFSGNSCGSSCGSSCGGGCGSGCGGGCGGCGS